MIAIRVVQFHGLWLTAPRFGDCLDEVPIVWLSRQVPDPIGYPLETH